MFSWEADSTDIQHATPHDRNQPSRHLVQPVRNYPRVPTPCDSMVPGKVFNKL